MECVVNFTSCFVLLKAVKTSNYFRPPTKYRKGNVFTRVRHSVHRGSAFPRFHGRPDHRWQSLHFMLIQWGFS